jgi:hypothetical protein
LLLTEGQAGTAWGLKTRRKKKCERERERERNWGEVLRDTILGGVRSYISGFEGSQAVPVCPSGTGNAYYWNFVIYIKKSVFLSPP